MRTPLESTHLYKLLEQQDTNLAAKVRLIREKVADWLAYVPVTFPHYPSHAIDHSDRIAAQLSRILFRVPPSGGAAIPTVEFSTSELYCLLCAIYLHDIGMVVSPAAQAELTKNDAWKNFIATGGKGHTLYGEYEAAEAKKRPGIVDEHHLQATSALRQLIAEFIRRDHHERAVETLVLLPDVKSLVDDGDRMVFDTIMNICRGHGLTSRDLQDKRVFPQKQLILDDYVNVRFLARLLRIGDLLDLSKKRAGHLALTAVAALPKSAVPHWDQYIAKTIESPDPDRLEYTFECGNQDTHRVLRDWLGWLEEEVKETGIEQQHAERHKGWTPPKCKVASVAVATETATDPSETIMIKPAAGAGYTFHDWKFQMDQPAVIKLLTTSIYADEHAFIRELLQNALDANRCQMYKDFARLHPGDTPPKWPTKFDEVTRNNYPVTMRIERDSVELPGESAPRECDVFVIEDVGTGMTEDVIRDYFLQIGRSFYKSDAFRRACSFRATSRFGIGFLSVFDASRQVVVETFPARADGSAGDGIRIRLHGPASYLLTEKIPASPARRRPGTTIRVALTERALLCAEISLQINNWCLALEFPTTLNGNPVGPEPWIDGQVLAEWPHVPGGKLVRRVFTFETAACHVTAGVVARVDDTGEYWAGQWPEVRDRWGDAVRQPEPAPSSVLALHGVRVNHRLQRSTQGLGKGKQFWHMRIDVRGDDDLAIAAHRARADLPASVWEGICDHMDGVVRSHLDAVHGDDIVRACRYKQSVIDQAPINRQAWYTYPNMVPTLVAGQLLAASFAQAVQLPQVTLATDATFDLLCRQHKSTHLTSTPILQPIHLMRAFSHSPRNIFVLYDSAVVSEVDGHFVLTLRAREVDETAASEATRERYSFMPLPSLNVAGIRYKMVRGRHQSRSHMLINTQTIYGRWLEVVYRTLICDDQAASGDDSLVSLIDLTKRGLFGLDVRLIRLAHQLNEHPNLPRACRPPEELLTDEFDFAVVDLA